MAAKNQRDGSKEQYWREIVSRHAASGMQTGEFCRKEGCDQNQFYWWRRELKKREERKKTGSRNEPKANKIEFLPVRLVESTTPIHADKRESIEIRMSGDVTVLVPWGANPMLLEAMMRGLRVRND